MSEISQDEMSRVSEAIRQALEDAFDVDGYDVMVATTEDWDFEADIPKEASLAIEGFVDLESGKTYEVDGNSYTVYMKRQEGRDMYFEVTRES